MPVRMEEWKSIKGYEGLYEVSNLGRVRTLRAKHHCKDPEGVMIPQNMKGSYSVVLYEGKRGMRYITKTIAISHLVFQAFNPWNLKVDDIIWVEHMNGDIADCHVDNLKAHITSKALERIHQMRSASLDNIV